MNKKILIGITAIIAFFLIYQGSKNQKTTNGNQLASLAKAAKPTERPRDPWVFRSVLNEKPRMITIALNERLWVAYDTQYGSIYKAWYGGVDFNGAVYTTSHGPQPTSQGSSYINGLEDDNVWYLDGKKIEDEDFSFKGYSFFDNAVVLSYEINNSESEVIKIFERPEIVITKSGSLALKRIFEVQDAQNTKVELKTPIQSILDTNGFSANAPYTLEQISTSSYEWGEKINYIAKISLNKKQKTTVTTFFDLRVGEENAAKEEVKKTVPLEPQADINFSNKKINIDGQIDESWLSEEYLKIDNLIYGENEIEGAFKMLWDNEYLYILHKITDSNVTELDGIDFFIDSKRERGSEYDSNDSYYSLIMEDLAKLDVSNTKTNAKIIVRQSEEGYIVESSIPWSDLNVNPFDGMKMGFSTHLNNVGSSTSSKYSWRSVSNDLFENPASFASIKLIDQKNNSIETNTEGFAKGILVNMYKVGVSLSNVPEVVENQNPNISKIMPSIDHLSERGSFHGINDSFVINAKAFVNIQEEGEYEFRITSDDGSKLHVNNELLIENDDLQGPTPKNGKVTLTEGIHEIFIEHFENTGGEALLLEWKRPNSSDFEIITRESLFVKGDSIMETDDEIKDVIIKSPISTGVKKAIPGDGSILTDVHPSYDLFTARPKTFEPKVGGMDWLPDGRLIICNWEPDGGVYVLDGIQGNDREKITVKRIAAGLAEPLGVKVVDGRIFILQKQELTELIDHDGDEVIDEYKTIANGWGVTSNFHEFAFGLVYKDGYFYGTLATAINPGGASTQPQNHDRGTVVKISMDGDYEFIARGLRTPNGIGLGVDGEIFVADNQGDWLPSSKIVHISEGAFLGNRSVRPETDMDLEEKPPLVWLPQNEIGNSPSTPGILNDGPYAGQMMHGEVTHGGLKRVFVEKVNGEYQGALFRFTQGLEAGVNRLTIGPDGGIYIGGIGNGGNWGQAGKEWFGLQRLKYNGKTTFEMLAIRIKNNGMEIEFTEPLSEVSGNDAEDYAIQQFWYKPTEKYGGPKMDLEDLEVKSVTIDESRTKAFLQIEGLKEGHVIYFKLNSHMKNNDGERLWTTESWYTLNNMPLVKQGEKNWITLFDGETMNGWRGFGRDDVPKGWTVEDGAIHFTPGIEGGDIITVDKFCDFELEVEWKISKNGNSGIFFRSTEDYGVPWQTAPEYQILDNTGHWDGKSEYTSAGSNYALHKPAMDMTKPVGEWNQAKIIAKGNHVEHWMNGMKIVEYELHSESWNKLVSESKFNSMADYGKRDCGHIDFQDHGDNVWYRNIRIRPIIDQHAGTNPIPQEDEWAQSWWPLRHIKKLEYIQANSDRELVFMGDSITQGWEYPGINKIWEEAFSKYKPYNIGFSGDRTEHLLWRIQNGEMQNINPKLSVIMIGTNNSHGGHEPKIIRDGIEKIVRTLRDMFPEMKILLLGIFPCGKDANDTTYNQWIPKGINPRQTNMATNSEILKLADGKIVHYLDIGKNFMEDDGITISPDIMPDFLHLSEKGYQIWANSIIGKIEEILN